MLNETKNLPVFMAAIQAIFAVFGGSDFPFWLGWFIISIVTILATSPVSGGAPVSCNS
jgi:hypothetical protein